MGGTVGTTGVLEWVYEGGPSRNGAAEGALEPPHASDIVALDPSLCAWWSSPPCWEVLDSLRWCLLLIVDATIPAAPTMVLQETGLSSVALESEDIGTCMCLYS